MIDYKLSVSLFYGVEYSTCVECFGIRCKHYTSRCPPRRNTNFSIMVNCYLKVRASQSEAGLMWVQLLPASNPKS